MISSSHGLTRFLGGSGLTCMIFFIHDLYKILVSMSSKSIFLIKLWFQTLSEILLQYLQAIVVIL